MKVTRLEIPDVLLLEPKVHQDERGFFLESYNRRTFKEETGLDTGFVQDNTSFSVRNVLRGLHYQIRRAQGKLVQAFAGALQGQRARKGVFITTSSYTTDAKEYAARIDSRIVLIDGSTLAQLMIDYGVGVAVVNNYEIKRMDGDYFAEG